MRNFEDRPNVVGDAAIDRLVDGELLEIERRELLLQLENDPEGWRRCCLAFLEDQSWRQALAHSASPIVNSEPPEMPSVPLRSNKHWARSISVAASIIGVAFAAGFALGGISKESRLVEVAKLDPAHSVQKAREVEVSAEPVDEVGFINIVDGSLGESPTHRVPIYSVPRINEKLIREQPPAVPDYIRARLERQGYQVEERRKLVSVTLKDGRQVSIPVDEVALDFIGQKPL